MISYSSICLTGNGDESNDYVHGRVHDYARGRDARGGVDGASNWR